MADHEQHKGKPAGDTKSSGKPDEKSGQKSGVQSAEKSGQKSGEKSGGKRDDEQSTFETDISESDEEGTTVRQAEVREDDLSEVKPSASGQKH